MSLALQINPLTNEELQAAERELIRIGCECQPDWDEYLLENSASANIFLEEEVHSDDGCFVVDDDISYYELTVDPATIVYYTVYNS